MSLATVKLWGRTVGQVAWDTRGRIGVFQYDKEFQATGWQVAPQMMPLGPKVYQFSELSPTTYHGLPGLLADSLPDKFGTDIINAWLSTHGRSPASLNPVERLCYTGKRGMGALEFEPAGNIPGIDLNASVPVDVMALADLAERALARHTAFSIGAGDGDVLTPLLQVSTSPGGGIPKALIAVNEATREIRSGQADAGPGFSYWLLKFDHLDRDRRRIDGGTGLGRMEYAYHLMARQANIAMTDCRLFQAGGMDHFMTKRFDREDGGKVHIQTLCAMGHLDANERPGVNSYERAFLVARQLGLSPEQKKELVRRMAFNVMACNYDDHTKNLAFKMDREGRWSLAPAYDLTYSYDMKLFAWENQHLMSVAGKTTEFATSDLLEAARHADIREAEVKEELNSVASAVSRWMDFAHEAHVPEKLAAACGAKFPKEIIAYFSPQKTCLISHEDALEQEEDLGHSR